MSDRPALVVGLGNPGPEYAGTRHNLGHDVVDELARRAGASWRSEKKFQMEVAQAAIGGAAVRLARPTTYMNVSGSPVARLARFYKLEPEAVLVVHDDLELAVGEVRLKRGGGHGGHNGVRDVARHLGPAFRRLRLGIGRPRGRLSVEAYVLKAPTAGERQALAVAVERAVEAAEALVERGDAAAERVLTG